MIVMTLEKRRPSRVAVEEPVGTAESRREFLKTISRGAFGCAALVLPGACAAPIQDTDHEIGRAVQGFFKALSTRL
jgi:hypothetical protein